MNYPELHQGLLKFRELFQRKILMPNVINGNEPFLQRVVISKEWTPTEALRVYNILKPHEIKLLKIGFNLKSVPPINKITQAPTQKVLKNKAPRKKLIGYDKDAFVITFPYNRLYLDAVKKIPEAKWNLEKRYWNVPLAQLKYVREFAITYKFEFTQKGLHMIKNIAENYRASYQAEKVDLDLPMLLEPYPFQYAGIAYGIKNKQYLLFLVVKYHFAGYP